MIHLVSLVVTSDIFQVYPDPQQYVFPRGKGWSSCDVFRESQLLVIGGYYTNTSITECDVPKIGGQHAMLLGQENVEQAAWWHAPMDNVTGYRVPDKIVARVGGEYVLALLIIPHSN